MTAKLRARAQSGQDKFLGFSLKAPPRFGRRGHDPLNVGFRIPRIVILILRKSCAQHFLDLAALLLVRLQGWPSAAAYAPFRDTPKYFLPASGTEIVSGTVSLIYMPPSGDLSHVEPCGPIAWGRVVPCRKWCALCQWGLAAPPLLVLHCPI